MKIPCSHPFPPAEHLLETADQAEHVADLLYQQIPLDSGDNPASLPGFDRIRPLDQMPLRDTHHDLGILERLLDVEIDLVVPESLSPDVPYFCSSNLAGWPASVRRALDALRDQLGGIKYYFYLPNVKCRPGWNILDGKKVPMEQPPHKIQPERGQPFPAAIVAGMRQAVEMLREAVEMLREAAREPDPTDARDAWIYAQAMEGTPWGSIQRSLENDHPEWECIETVPGIRDAAFRYAEKHSKPDPPTRQPGRRKKPKGEPA